MVQSVLCVCAQQLTTLVMGVCHSDSQTTPCMTCLLSSSPQNRKHVNGDSLVYIGYDGTLQPKEGEICMNDRIKKYRISASFKDHLSDLALLLPICMY